MTVRDLIERLADVPDDTVVVTVERHGYTEAGCEVTEAEKGADGYFGEYVQGHVTRGCEVIDVVVIG